MAVRLIGGFPLAKASGAPAAKVPIKKCNKSWTIRHRDGIPCHQRLSCFARASSMTWHVIVRRGRLAIWHNPTKTHMTFNLRTQWGWCSVFWITAALSHHNYFQLLESMFQLCIFASSYLCSILQAIFSRIFNWVTVIIASRVEGFEPKFHINIEHAYSRTSRKTTFVFC